MKVILDTDPGIDDAMALLYLQASTELELAGITTVPGNASLEQCTTNALFLCDLFGISAPVYRGLENPIDGSERSEFPDFVHGANGLGDIPISGSMREPELASAPDYLINVTSAQPGELAVIAIGQLTNIALAINGDDKFRTNVRQIIIMGGTVSHPGNVSPFAEANIFSDPEAAAIVFNSGIPLTMVGLDVTMKSTMSLAMVDEIYDRCPGVGNSLSPATHYYASYYRESSGMDSFPVHDSSAIAYAKRPELFTTQQGTLSCVLDGEQRGRTVFKEDENGCHTLCIDVDSKAFLKDYRQSVLAEFGS